jgi:hypothetical protein
LDGVVVPSLDVEPGSGTLFERQAAVTTKAAMARRGRSDWSGSLFMSPWYHAPEERSPMPLIETEEAARRLARAIASDLSLYNEDKIINGITNDNLFETLAEEIEEGRALYKRRVSPELYPKNFYDRALVDILIKAKGHIKSKIW